MFAKLAVISLALLGVVEGTSINAANGDVPLHSDAGRNLMHHARELANNNYNYNGQQQAYQQDVDSSFLQAYSVKFQGCHHVQQWNDEAQDVNDVRILTKRLVRFRLCPANECSSDLGGCSSHYGDYIVDMETYLSAYYENAMASRNNANGNNNNNNNYQNQNQNFDISRYMSCSQYEIQNNGQYNNNNNYYGDEDVSYYLGAYCAEQGGEIRLGLFVDDTCTSFSQNQNLIQGLPYTQKSMVSTSCVSCSGYNDNGEYGVNGFCDSVYQISGKCETKMNSYYPNEAACSYIEGIKVIREDGVIRTSATRKSRAAAISIGIFLTVAVLLAGYVYYLRTKLSRARINLNASSA